MMRRCFPAAAWCKQHAMIPNETRAPSVKEAIHGLYMSCAGHYFDRAARGLGIPVEVSAQLLTLSQAIYDGRNYVAVLSDAIGFFTKTVASVENGDVREAIRAAQFTLRAAMQDTQTELPIVSVRAADPGDWLL